jgi:ABC-type multidrug transport system ATPase subunit
VIPGAADAVVLAGVTAGYVEERPVVRDLSLRLPHGGVVRLAGPNGSGKSTVLELVSGYLRPWSGTVTVCGHDAATTAARAARRVVRTQPALYDHMTIRDHLTFMARVQGGDLQEQLERAGRLGLAPWYDERAAALSSGTAKKLWYLLGTVGSCELLVLDEPFNAVDEDGIRSMVRDLEEAADAARTVVIVCHTVPVELSVDGTVRLGKVEE